MCFDTIIVAEHTHEAVHAIACYSISVQSSVRHNKACFANETGFGFDGKKQLDTG